METFKEAREFVHNPGFKIQRQAALASLEIKLIDKPIRGIIKGLSVLPFCFTLQSCYGHFVYVKDQDPGNLEPLPDSRIERAIKYRIAYIAICIEDSPRGRKLFRDLGHIPDIDRDYIQFGSAVWFWDQQVNSYALQVEPIRFSTSDTAMIGYEEALYIERIRDLFFKKLNEIVADQPKTGR